MLAGIGLELVKQLLARGDVVVAAVRDPSKASNLNPLNAANLHVIKLDVEKPETIQVSLSASAGFRRSDSFY